MEEVILDLPAETSIFISSSKKSTTTFTALATRSASWLACSSFASAFEAPCLGASLSMPLVASMLMSST